MTEHTKWPWFVDGDKHAMNLDIVGPEGRIAMMDCENLEIDDDALVANARLISSAPDLLEALEGLIVVNETTFPTALKKKNAFEREVAQVMWVVRQAKGAA
jgi:hypothetical protein